MPDVDKKKIMEYAIAMFIAIMIAMVFFLMASSILINSTVDAMQRQVNSLKVNCSTLPFGDSFQFTWKGETIYCQLYQQSILDGPGSDDINREW